MLRAKSLQDDLGARGDREEEEEQEEPSPALMSPVDGAVAWAVGEAVEESSVSSGGGGGGERAPGSLGESEPLAGDVASSPPNPSPASPTSPSSSPSPLPPPTGAEARATQVTVLNESSRGAAPTERADDGELEGVASASGILSSQHPSAAAAVGASDAGDASRETHALRTAPAAGGGGGAPSLGDKGAADVAAGVSMPGETRPGEVDGQPPAASSKPSISPWIGRGGSDDGNSDGGSVALPPAVAAPPPVGPGNGGDGNAAAAMKVCVTDIVVEAAERAGGGEVSDEAPPPPASGKPVAHYDDDDDDDAAPKGLPSAVSPTTSTAAAVSGESDPSAAGGSSPAEDGAVVAAPAPASSVGQEPAQVSEGDHLALAHLLLRAREDSSCLPSYREGDTGDNSVSGGAGGAPLPIAAPTAHAAAAPPPAATAVTTAAGPPDASSSGGPDSVPAVAVTRSEATQDASLDATMPPPPPSQQQQNLAVAAPQPSRRCIFPGDEETEMNQEVIAVERLSSDAEAWLSGKGGVPPRIVPSASGSSLGEKPSRYRSTASVLCLCAQSVFEVGGVHRCFENAVLGAARLPRCPSSPICSLFLFYCACTLTSPPPRPGVPCPAHLHRLFFWFGCPCCCTIGASAGAFRMRT